MKPITIEIPDPGDEETVAVIGRNMVAYHAVGKSGAALVRNRLEQALEAADGRRLFCAICTREILDIAWEPSEGIFVHEACLKNARALVPALARLAVQPQSPGSSAPGGLDAIRRENAQALMRRAFRLGFAVSREGFNGECAFSELSPTPRELKELEIDDYDFLGELETWALEQLAAGESDGKTAGPVTTPPQTSAPSLPESARSAARMPRA